MATSVQPTPIMKSRGVQPKRCKAVQLASNEVIKEVQKPVPHGQLEATIQPFTGTSKPPTSKRHTIEKERIQVDEELQLKIDTIPILKEYQIKQNDIQSKDPYMTNTTLFTPHSRKSFYKFMSNTYRDFKLIQQVKGKIDEDACAKLGATKDTVEAFLYQKFIREYIRNASPYRGILVYHGLGSGKTCSAIAAAEALYGTSNKKIIVMTPFSLRGNFMSEISFCGFRHFNVQNHWVKESLVSEGGVTYLYANSVMSLSEKYLNEVLKRPMNRRVVWIPDFTEKPNFDTLEQYERDDIRNQITNIIENRIKFISYNGITAKELKRHACTIDEHGDRFFDNSVIVIDEVHNLTRLMQGEITPYIQLREEGRPRKIPVEPIVPGKWKPGLCNSDLNYKRSYLFYKLLSDARNSKIIGLSGTPIINFPDELGILSNILAGYTECVEFDLKYKRVDKKTDDDFISTFKKIVEFEPRVDMVRLYPLTEKFEVLISIFNEGYEKVESNGDFIGVKYNPKAQDDIRTIFERIKPKLQNYNYTAERYVSYPRLPVNDKEFKDEFIDPVKLTIKNKVVLQKRLTGLISYYKGSKDEYMPRVTKDEVVKCEMSNYVLSKYTEVRKKEIEGEKNKEEKGDKYAVVEEFAKMSNPSNYRFRSRALCNFAFPPDIQRPFPNTPVEEVVELEEIDKDDIIITDEVIEELEEVKAEEAEAEAEAENIMGGARPKIAPSSIIPPEPEQEEKTMITRVLSYHDSIKKAMDTLNLKRSEYLQLDAPEQKNTVAEYSKKIDKMLRNILISKGSNLVYSQFKTVEGLGVLGLTLKANGFVEIEIEGGDFIPKSDNILRFSQATIESFKQGPDANIKRFMFLTGDGLREKRNLILNIFNGNFDKIPENMRIVLEENGYKDKKNMYGEICWVFGITGAGAEGISLKNCRSVHIMEPYWNKVRLDQVKGRAIRICSHQDLPFKEREVEIYTYYTVFSKIQMKELDESIRRSDKGDEVNEMYNVETSDENVYNIGVKKDKINQEILDIMKETAMDCGLNAADNGVQCFEVLGHPKQYLFDPKLEIDKIQTTIEIKEVHVEKTEQKTERETAKVVKLNRNGKEEFIIYPKKGGMVYNIYERVDDRLENPIGELPLNPATGTFKGMIPTFT